MNIHHLELFYYVAKYEGITAAVRKMPYGIQQPAVSGQILQLEKSLGVKLFNRRPFALTSAGEDLYDYLYPFFSRLREVEERLKGEERCHLRIAASSSVLRHHLPEVLSDLRRREPSLHLTLREVEPANVHALLSTQQVDLAVSIIYGKLTDGLHAKELLKLPLVLLVPTSVKGRTLKDFLKPDDYGKGLVGKYPLVGLPDGEIVSKIFQEELNRRQIHWPPNVEVESLAMVADYAARDFGVGFSVSIPGVDPPPGLRQIVLRDFPAIRLGILYQGTLKPLANDFLEAARKKARALAKKK